DRAGHHRCRQHRLHHADRVGHGDTGGASGRTDRLGDRRAGAGAIEGARRRLTRTEVSAAREAIMAKKRKATKKRAKAKKRAAPARRKNAAARKPARKAKGKGKTRSAKPKRR